MASSTTALPFTLLQLRAFLTATCPVQTKLSPILGLLLAASFLLGKQVWLCSRQNNIPPKYVHALIPGTCQYVTCYIAKETLELWSRVWALKWEDYPWLSEGAQCNHMNPYTKRTFSSWKQERWGKKQRSERCEAWEGLGLLL